MAGPRNSTDSSARGTDGGTDAEDELVAEAADALYALPPAEFMSRRTELVGEAKASTSAAAAKRIATLRKPTVAASIVNRLVLADPTSIEDLVELGERMRTAQDALDAALLRDLSTERRALVSRLAGAALKLSATTGPSNAVRDEVTSTLDAAIADTGVAARLGRLERSESWSGFGFAVTGSPELTLVRGGRDTTRRREPSRPVPAASTKPAAPKVPATARRRLARALDKARGTFESAEAALATAEQGEQTQAERVRELTDELAQMHRELDDAKRTLDQTRREAKSARARRREARSALDRAQRQSDV